MGALIGEFRGGCDFWISIPAGNCTALSGGARRRRHGPGRCEADGPDWRISGYVADAAGAGSWHPGRDDLRRSYDCGGVAKKTGPQTGPPERASSGSTGQGLAICYVDLPSFSNTVRCVPGYSGASCPFLRQSPAELVFRTLPMTLTMFPLKALQQFLRNPLMIRMALGLAIFICLFLVGSVLIRKMRQQITVEMSPAGLLQEATSAFGFAAYNGPSQQLRQNEKVLQRLLEAYTA